MSYLEKLEKQIRQDSKRRHHRPPLASLSPLTNIITPSDKPKKVKKAHNRGTSVSSLLARRPQLKISHELQEPADKENAPPHHITGLTRFSKTSSLKSDDDMRNLHKISNIPNKIKSDSSITQPTFQKSIKVRYAKDYLPSTDPALSNSASMTSKLVSLQKNMNNWFEAMDFRYLKPARDSPNTIKDCDTLESLIQLNQFLYVADLTRKGRVILLKFRHNIHHEVFNIDDLIGSKIELVEDATNLQKDLLDIELDSTTSLRCYDRWHIYY